MNDSDINLMEMTLRRVKAKLEAARDAGPFGPTVELEPSEAVLVWRLIFGQN